MKALKRTKAEKAARYDKVSSQIVKGGGGRASLYRSHYKYQFQIIDHKRVHYPAPAPGCGGSAGGRPLASVFFFSSPRYDFLLSSATISLDFAFAFGSVKHRAPAHTIARSLRATVENVLKSS
ncbi:hypothetical protein EVAR_65555_1 [Eumeta japonica]|uniref:Uncharacterized protein n=1 Tax=Eumeta variegata TaxID=151549 RepID=A0A4C1ZAA1_EUMVA|nr:hypothetical protein EVAR_65555_1 [Eumeta japonica]